jgi:hypothetical protein
MALARLESSQSSWSYARAREARVTPPTIAAMADGRALELDERFVFGH